MRALSTTMTASRPGKWTSARKAPKGTPIRAARSTAERLTMRDSRTIAISAGSSTSWSAETSVGMKNPAFLDFLQTTRLWSNLQLSSSNLQLSSYVCMPDLLTTDEAAIYLRLSPRKLYELLAKGAVPCTKVTGRWLFPRAALDRWVMAGLITSAAFAHATAPPIVGGSHDLLLELTLRESGCGLASLPEGSEAGLQRLARGEVMVAAVHLHRPDGDDEAANIEAVAAAPGLHDAVVISFARHEQGIVTAPGNPLKLSDIASVANSRARLAQRPPGAGAQLLLLALLARAKIAANDLALMTPVCATGMDIAQAVRSNRADCGIATRSVALAAGLNFLPITWEHFDLVLRQRDYFLPGPQALFEFMRTAALRERAMEFGGYDVDTIGAVRLVN